MTTTSYTNSLSNERIWSVQTNCYLPEYNLNLQVHTLDRDLETPTAFFGQGDTLGFATWLSEIDVRVLNDSEGQAAVFSSLDPREHPIELRDQLQGNRPAYPVISAFEASVIGPPQNPENIFGISTLFDAILQTPIPFMASPPSGWMNLSSKLVSGSPIAIAAGWSIEANRPVLVLYEAGLMTLFWLAKPPARVARRALTMRVAQLLHTEMREDDLR